MDIKQSSDGQRNLHFYREGDEYFRQKSPVFLKEFTNVLFTVLPQPPDSEIIYLDLTKPLVFDDNTFDHVNAYHVFEHLSPKEGERFAKEIYRVIKPGGIFRVSVPDLERIAREYLMFLEAGLKEPSKQNLLRYRWAVMEMIDQATREVSGGCMLESLKSGELDQVFVKQRYGDVFDEYFDQRAKKERGQWVPPPKKPIIEKLLSLTPQKIINKWKHTVYENKLKNKLKEIGGDPHKSKERVRWMYDRLSLQLLVEQCGFGDFAHKEFNDSDIPHWDKYNLDQSNYGEHALDPSVYIECKKR